MPACSQPPRGRSVPNEHIYIDDSISGATTLTRLRATARMLTVIASAKTPPFDVLIGQVAERPHLRGRMPNLPDGAECDA
jgi:hypothetical protein